MEKKTETLQQGSIVNVHRCDGSATGGHVYVGIDAFAGADRRVPEVILESIDDGSTCVVPVDEIAWVDVLATPFHIDAEK